MALRDLGGSSRIVTRQGRMSSVRYRTHQEQPGMAMACVFLSAQRTGAIAHIVSWLHRRRPSFRVLAGSANLAVAGPSAAKRVSYSRLPMSNHPGIEGRLPRLPIHQAIGAAIGTVLALVAIADALIIVAFYPALSGYVIAVAAGMGIGAIALAVHIATGVFWRVRLPSNNDAWVFW
jgi:hypothetical protein